MDVDYIYEVFREYSGGVELDDFLDVWINSSFTARKKYDFGKMSTALIKLWETFPELRVKAGTKIYRGVTQPPELVNHNFLEPFLEYIDLIKSLGYSPTVFADIIDEIRSRREEYMEDEFETSVLDHFNYMIEKSLKKYSKIMSKEDYLRVEKYAKETLIRKLSHETTSLSLSYTPRSEIQSWTTDYGIAETFMKMWRAAPNHSRYLYSYVVSTKDVILFPGKTLYELANNYDKISEREVLSCNMRFLGEGSLSVEHAVISIDDDIYEYVT
jgi:hypothetical protein